MMTATQQETSSEKKKKKFRTYRGNAIRIQAAAWQTRMNENFRDSGFDWIIILKEILKK